MSHIVKVQQLAITLVTLICSACIKGEPVHSYLAGRTIHIAPSEASFVLPRNWFECYLEEHNNLYLTREQLQKVEKGGDSWDADFARVVNAVLPFERCAVHAGGEVWGKESRSFGDVQMRVYVGDWPLDLLKRRITQQGLETAKSIYMERMPGDSSNKFSLKLPVGLKEDSVGAWQRYALAFPVYYDDYGGTARLDFYARVFGAETIVLVFMYADSSAQKEFIQGIVSSFHHP